ALLVSLLTGPRADRLDLQGVRAVRHVQVVRLGSAERENDNVPAAFAQTGMILIGKHPFPHDRGPQLVTVPRLSPMTQDTRRRPDHKLSIFPRLRGISESMMPCLHIEVGHGAAEFPRILDDPAVIPP